VAAVANFVVQERSRTGSAASEFLVVNPDDQHRPVASFPDRAAADAHAAKLNAGPLDWDEQEAWQDPDEDDGW
jgi:hypothetical protein